MVTLQIKIFPTGSQTHRLAYRIQLYGAGPNAALLVTFTPVFRIQMNVIAATVSGNTGKNPIPIVTWRVRTLRATKIVAGGPEIMCICQQD